MVFLDYASIKGQTIEERLYNLYIKAKTDLEWLQDSLIGFIDSQKQRAIKDEISKEAHVTMFATSSMAKNGLLRNLTSNFSNEHFVLEDDNNFNNDLLRTSLEIMPTENVVPGNYMLTVSARYNNDITISKVVDLNIT